MVHTVRTSSANGITLFIFLLGALESVFGMYRILCITMVCNWMKYTSDDIDTYCDVNKSLIIHCSFNIGSHIQRRRLCRHRQQVNHRAQATMVAAVILLTDVQ